MENADRKVTTTPPKRFLPGLAFAIGYILSPLSWWNDIFVNLPLAYLLGNVTNFFFPGSFQIGMIAAYWLSNLVGILFMLWGGSRLLGKAPPKRRELWLSVGVSFLYTLALYLLMQWGIVRPFEV
ncbi:MAG: hypothetical protein ONB46_01960 [candidate division KSB1 bacterium]|nr:hypothetical protein [candidate division KSB1 bacterium]MDZ7364433.1 hypothetical protein [candidate division KSB1 bacterium]MDZ7402805.1 hypothetical protein [candidate division KSB1 bacterium]